MSNVTAGYAAVAIAAVPRDITVLLPTSRYRNRLRPSVRLSVRPLVSTLSSEPTVDLELLHVSRT